MNIKNNIFIKIDSIFEFIFLVQINEEVNKLLTLWQLHNKSWLIFRQWNVWKSLQRLPNNKRK